jgi:hypothetical protein
MTGSSHRDVIGLIAFAIGVWRAGADASAGSVLTSSDWTHPAPSAVWGIGMRVAIVLAAVAIRGWFRWFSIASLVVVLGFTAPSSVAIQGIEENDTPLAGALERVTAYGFAKSTLQG